MTLRIGESNEWKACWSGGLGCLQRRHEIPAGYSSGEHSRHDNSVARHASEHALGPSTLLVDGPSF